MSKGLLTFIALGVLAALGSLSIHASDQQQEFVQDRFAIGFLFNPPAEDSYYADVAAAHFTMWLGVHGAQTPERVQRQIELCEKYDLKAIVATAGLPPAQLPESPVVWGYYIRDEPNARDFPELRKTVDEIRKARPGRLAYINLFPNYASEQQLGTKTYEEHVRRFVEEVGVDVLSMDHYPWMKPGEVLRDTPIASLTKGDYLVGVFTHTDGRRAVLLSNYSFAYAAWPTVGFDVSLSKPSSALILLNFRAKASTLRKN